ncbi:uncharacterized protein LOC129566056 [Sitodiplosis mosellana]|uniref:uncharacterized protein LOC129566056 n=1 Tax=Sitodiplosis mosellana TaxID=263140 RepID=UPI0024442F0C|nr:uncharacterized protein LOC129566056 [Sitodiplosis mosellana]
MAAEQPPQIFKLNVDCFEKMFEYLSIKDLHSFGQTCKRMQRVAGHFYQQQFSGTSFHYDCKFVDFREYAEILIIEDLTNALNSINIDWALFKSVKKIQFKRINLDVVNMMPQEFSNQIEEVRVVRCEMNEPFFERVLGRFPNMKSLKIHRSDFDWFTQKYLKLQHFAWYPQNIAQPVQAGQLEMFLRQNSSIRSLSAMSWLLLPNQITMMEVKLDDLGIVLVPLRQDICEFANSLHAKGAYKRLHIMNYDKTNQEFVDRLISLKSLVRFVAKEITETVDLSSLVNLKVLTVRSGVENIANKPALARSLENLIEVNFCRANIDDILPFVHLSPKLKKIHVVMTLGENSNQAIDPVTMNREREKLLTETLYVSKVTIYIPESNYLATKWKTTETDLKLIEIQRVESFDLIKSLLF